MKKADAINAKWWLLKLIYISIAGSQLKIHDYLFLKQKIISNFSLEARDFGDDMVLLRRVKIKRNDVPCKQSNKIKMQTFFIFAFSFFLL